MSWYEVYLKDIEKKGTLENYVDDKIKNKKILIQITLFTYQYHISF